MRTIKFRGQRIDNKEWVYGFFFKTSRGSFVGEYLDEQEVIPETVGQFTGLTDKDGEEIYEGDFVKIFYNQNSENYAGNNFNYTEHTCIVEFSTYS